MFNNPIMNTGTNVAKIWHLNYYLAIDIEFPVHIWIIYKSEFNKDITIFSKVI